MLQHPHLISDINQDGVKSMTLRSISQGIGFTMKIEILREECTDHLYDLWVFLFAHTLIHIIRFRAFFPTRLVLKSDLEKDCLPPWPLTCLLNQSWANLRDRRGFLFISSLLCRSFFLFFLLVLFDAFFQQAINLLCTSLFCLYCWTSWTQPNWVILPP